MVDRQDIDALLISALYGELTPADEARLTTHLESHPADRSALDSLTEIRATIRTSGFSTLQLDPPQAISAMLLQEAARRAPKLVRAKDDNEVGWFTRLVRSFASHPAMAAAAMLVMVAGVGGLLYMKNANPMAEPTAADQVPAATMIAAGSGSSSTTIVAPTAPPIVPADKDQFGVDLADPAKAEGAKLDDKVSNGTAPMRKLEKDARDYFEREKQQAQDKPKQDPSAKKGGVDHGMIVNRDELTPKELTTVEQKPTAPPSKPMPAKSKPADQASDPEVQGRVTNVPGYANGSGAGPSTGNAAPPRPPQVKSPAPTPTPDAKPTTTAPNATNFAWAKDQHARVTTLVHDGNCRDAATIAAQIAAKANDYYNQYVATDRALKACTAYINDAREKDAERTNKQRAQKRVDANEVSPPAPNVAR